MSMIRPTPISNKPAREPKKKCWLRRVSSKLAESLVLYHRVTKPAWLALNPRCQFEWMGFPCGKIWGVTVHHKHGRGKYLNDARFFMTICPKHHVWVEDHKREARRLGFILYR